MQMLISTGNYYHYHGGERVHTTDGGVTLELPCTIYLLIGMAVACQAVIILLVVAYLGSSEPGSESEGERCPSLARCT